jgi:transposase
MAVEAMGPTWAFVDALAPTGAALCVVDPRKTKLKVGHAAKTDRLDARRLADALRRDSVVSIDIPPPEIRALRELCRGRHHLVRLRTRLAQMIRALLLRCDAGEPPRPTLFAARALAWLATVELAPEPMGQLRRLERLYRAGSGGPGSKRPGTRPGDPCRVMRPWYTCSPLLSTRDTNPASRARGRRRSASRRRFLH